METGQGTGMRWLLISLGAATLAAAQETPALDEARVQIPYKELRALIEAARVKPPEAPPLVESTILSARYDIQWRGGSVAGVAEYEVQTFRDGPQVVPLAGDQLVIESVEPKEAVMVLKDKHYALAVEGRQRVKATVRFTLPARKAEDGFVVESPICPAVSASVQVRDIPAGRHVAVENGIPGEGESASRWQLGGARLLRLTLRDAPQPLPPPITMPATIQDATGETRVVGDGSFSSKVTWRVRHQSPLLWKLDLPEDLQIVSARVGGKPASPSRVDAKTVEFRLGEPANVDETVVELSYTGRGKAFDPARGELSLSLPGTALLVEKLRWNVAIPEGYEATSAQGNVTSLPGRQAGQLQLGKELCRGETPLIKIAYQLPPAVTMPAVIREAESEMRVVSDGAFSNKMTWRIRHQAPLAWKLSLPENLQIVSAKVNGKPASPSRPDDKTLEFRLSDPASGDESVVELTYTGKGKTLDPVRGDMALALPQTALLIEKVLWKVSIPAAYETVAAQGNVDFLPGKTSDEILLGKELCQGDAPAVRLFYQKPETSRKP